MFKGIDIKPVTNKVIKSLKFKNFNNLKGCC